MEATVTVAPPRAGAGEPHEGRATGAGEAPTPGGVPPLSTRLKLARAVLVVLLVLAVALLLQLLVVSAVQQRAAKEQAYDALRARIAEGTAPIGPTGTDGRLLPLGAPVALLEIPDLGVSEVVVEGTTSSALFVGPGHRRDTPLPGQVGVSVVYGRRAAYGGPFSKIGRLDEGALIRVTTGQGSFDFRVVAVRRAGDPLPPALEPGGGRLLLATAAGVPFLPSGVVRVDADLEGTAVGGPARAVTASALPAAEGLMAIDTGTLWALAFWLQVLILLSVAAVWSWYRWGPPRTWIVFLPPLLLVGLATAGEVAQLLPNLT